VERFGLLDERLHYCLDYEYWLRLAAGGATFAYVPAVLAGSRSYPQTKTLGSRPAVHQELNAMLRRRLGRVPDTWLLNEAHTLVELNSGSDRRWLPYSVSVVRHAMRLSWEWNRSVSPELLAMLFGPIVTGARRRAVGSRSATEERSAS